jgi:ATP-dependent Clp protease ATP-binding subunit ClpA
MDTAQRADERVVLKLEHICEALSAWTGIPIERLVPGRLGGADYGQLRQKLEENIFGQPEAIAAAVSALERRLELPERPGVRRPLWNALFAGPSGVGKTELARQLATHFFGDPKNLIQIDCSELDREHHIDRLVGSPPGYVGHGQGGQLTNELNRCRHGVLLLDEVEKAHPVILTKVILPLLGEGIVHDMNTGKMLDASNMIVVLTSNCGTNRLQEPAVGFATTEQPSEDAQEKAIRAAIASHYPSAVLSRLDDVIVFAPLSEASMLKIWRREVETLEHRLGQRGDEVRIEIDSKAEPLLLSHIRGSIRQEGARAIQRLFDKIVTGYCLKVLSKGKSGQLKVLVGDSGNDALQFRLAAGKSE